MSSPRIVLCIVGTRPEAIKMAPVIIALNNHPEFKVLTLATAQHREMLDQVLNIFSIQPDFDLNIMRPDQSLPELTARLMVGLDEIIATTHPDFILAQGDTTTVLVAALASFYRRVPFGHLEAGLRTGDHANPFPEEMNRTLVSRIAWKNFAPTRTSRQNLLDEGIADESIHVTGNTVIDALLSVARRDIPIGLDLDPALPLMLVTAHRRENFGEPFRNVCSAIRTLTERHAGLQVVYPVHPNPNIQEVAHRELGDCERIHLCSPLDYGPFVSLMRRSHLILTDSGGIQEEAPALGKPVLVLRSETERPEAMAAGVVRLVGTDRDNIVAEVSRLLEQPEAYAAMAQGASPYGDGRAASRIVEILERSSGEPRE